MTAGDAVQVAGGVVRVRLPPGQELEQHDGIARWSPDPAAGAFTVVSGAARDGGADALLAAERADSEEVEVEHDEEAVRGGLPVRHLRYRTRRHTPRVVLGGGDAPRHTGDEDVASVNEFLFVAGGERLVRVGYSVLADAPVAVRDALQWVLDAVRIGDER
ncbi:MAG: hypothetical protein ACXVSE_12765 [Solirubrobacteraceae bacterium]